MNARFENSGHGQQFYCYTWENFNYKALLNTSL